METRKLASFVRTVDAGSITAAAQSLHLAQSALSSHIASLEKDFGVALLVRGRRGIEVTDEGWSLYRYAQGILRLEQAAHLDLSNERQVTGLVTVGLASYSMAGNLSAPLLRAVREEHPGITLHLVEHLTMIMSQAVKLGQADMAVIYRTGRIDGVRFTEEITEDLVLVAGPASPALPARRDGIALEAASRLEFVLPDHQHTVRQLLERRFQAAGLPLRVVAEVESVHVLRETLASGPEVTVLPASAAARLLGGSPTAYRSVRLAGGLQATLALCTPEGPARSEAAAAVAATLQRLMWAARAGRD
ncbi:LysR substrate-binding domain-containing protein [Kineococcus sp. G2]|uniref:LysR substrate-binding domain-containing protein n=1 Tax=Kineococcus sp. G2 TaxID=3127484 RepID=UPI00301DC3FA